MMYFKSLLVLSTAIVTVGATKSSLRKRNLLDSFECIITEVATETPQHDTLYEHMCLGKGEDDNFDMIYQIDDNNNAISGALQALDIMHNSGRYKVIMTNVIIDTAPVVTTTPETEVEIDDLSQNDGRRQLAIEGTREMVIFRVTTPDAESPKTAHDIADAFFGTAGDPNNLASRYATCSFNKLKFIPGTGTGFINGVAEITVDVNANGSINFALQRAVTKAIIAKFGSSLSDEYDHIVYAIPYGTTFGRSESQHWLAYALMNSYLSVYNAENIMYISNQVHETGHNLGLMHSNHGSESYGDQSGTMGYGYGKEDEPHMCFNAAKSWKLGWYDDHSIEISDEMAAEGWKGNLNAFVDYEASSDSDYVILKVGTKYLIYNKKKDFNDGTEEFANTVTVTDAPTLDDFSDAVAALGSAGQTYDFDNITIELCSMQTIPGDNAVIDQATIGIYKFNESSCADGSYEDQAIEISDDMVSAGWKGTLKALVDETNSTDTEHVLKVGTKYLTYTKKMEEFNNETVAIINGTMDSNNETMDSNNVTVTIINGTMDSNNETMDSNNETVAIVGTMDSNNTTMDSNNTTMDSNNTTMDSNNTTMDSNNTKMDANSTTMDSNNTTTEFTSAVTISDTPTLDDFSDAIAALGSVGQTYKFDNITIELCSISGNSSDIDQATIGIYNTFNESSCGGDVMSSNHTDKIKSNSSLTTTFECVLVEIATELEEHETDYEHSCLAEGSDGEWDMRFHIDDNNGKIMNEVSEHGLDVLRHSGRYKVTMKEVVVNDDAVVSTTPDTEIEIEDLGEGALTSRRLGAKLGRRSVVIFHVTTPDAQPSFGTSKIADSFFGTSGDQASLAQRYAECSMGKLTFEPGTGYSFVNGVAKISVSVPARGSTIQALQKAVTETIIAEYGSSLRNEYDHVIYAVPTGTSFGPGGSTGWLAYAYMNSYLSVYNDKNIAYISHQVHETGHNLGLMHSNHGTQRSGDQSGTMGFGYGQESFPKMCFNAAISWQLGWYDDKSKEVTPGDTFTGKLSTFVDYHNTDGYVLMKCGTKYIIYNKAKGINSQTQEFANQVTISDMPFEGDFSDAVASLGSNGATYKFAGNVIEYCSTMSEGGVDSVKIAIYKQSDGSSCSNPASTRSTPPSPPPPPTGPPLGQPTGRPPTSAPVPPPPTSQPTHSNCTDDQMDVVITIHTDSKPEETSWYFKRYRGQKFASASEFTTPFKTHTYQLCVKATDTFEFHLLDSGGDGMQSTGFGQGFYTIEVDGELYSSGGSFKDEEVDYVQELCRKEDQTRLQFILNTGSAPEDVTWSLTSDPVEIVNHVGGPWPESEGKSMTYVAHVCLAKSACYKVGVHSEKGQGLKDGSVEVNWGDVNVGFSPFKTGYSEIFEFGSCDDETGTGRKLDMTEEVIIFSDFTQ